MPPAALTKIFFFLVVPHVSSHSLSPFAHLSYKPEARHAQDTRDLTTGSAFFLLYPLSLSIPEVVEVAAAVGERLSLISYFYFSLL